MDKNNAKVIARLCGLPAEFKARRNVSMIRLIGESGYSQIADQILESDIEAYLRAHPELIHAWLIYSENQRCTPAWLLGSENTEAHPNDPGWSVEYFSHVRSECGKLNFPDGFSACACFVKKEAESLRTLFEAG